MRGDVAAELVHDLFLDLPRLLPGDMPLEHAVPFLCGCLRKRARNALSRSRRRFQLLCALHAPAAAVECADQWDAAITCSAALRRLPRQTADILRTRYPEDRSVADIAERLGISQEAAWVRIHRAVLRARHLTSDDRSTGRSGVTGHGRSV